jgi:Uma2 family endonuclease
MLSIQSPDYYRAQFALLYLSAETSFLPRRLTGVLMGGKLEAMAVVINSETKLTYDDYVLLPEDGKIHEIIDGEHYMTPAPETYHQILSGRIQFQLYEQIQERELGVVFTAPTDVQLSEIDIVQPDLLVILAARKSIVSPAKVIGPPDLVIEILSESTGRKDRELKRDLYQKAKVPEYWLVDPKSQQITVFRLKGGSFETAGSFHDEIRYEAVEGVAVDLSKVW